MKFHRNEFDLAKCVPLSVQNSKQFVAQLHMPAKHPYFQIHHLTAKKNSGSQLLLVAN